MLFKNFGIVFNGKRLTQYERISSVIKMLIVYVNEALTLAVVHHIFECGSLIRGCFSSGTSKVSWWVYIFIY